MADMDPRDMTSIMGYQKPRTGSQSSSSMDPKKLSLSDMSRDQIRDMAREGSQETRQGEFGSMDAFMQRDTIERMNDEQKAKEAQHESRPRRWSFNMRDIPEEINIV